MNSMEKGINLHKIVIPKNATAIDSLAAVKLQYFLKERTNILHPIVSDDKVRYEPILSVGNTRQAEAIYKKYGADIQHDGFLIHTEKKNLFFVGNQGKSVLYSVYHFAEKYLNIRMYDADQIVVLDSGATFDDFIPQLHDLQTPSFEYRETLYRFPNISQEYADWHHLQNRSDMKRDWGMFVHTFNRLIPVNQYFDQHPEWFSEINGRRVKDGQLCLTNPEVLEELCKNLSTEIQKNPSAAIWSVSNNDNVNNCTCEHCRRSDSIYGSPSGTLLHFINEVAARFPEKTISTLAYQYTRKAPKNIQPRSNVNIMFCSIECGRQLPLDNNPKEHSFVEDLKTWSSLTHNIFLWDYVIQYRNMMNPFPNLHVLQPNLQLFHRNGITMMFEQGLNGGYGEMMEWRTYLIAKLLWNVNLNVDSLRSDFLQGYYGKAAPMVAQYIDTMQQALLDSKMFLNIYGYPVDGKKSYLSPEKIAFYQSLFQKAYQIVEGETTFTDHLRRLELSLDFAVLDLSMSNISKELSYFDIVDGKKYLRPEMMIKAYRFVEDCQRFDVRQLEEMGYPPKELLSNVFNLIEKSTQVNLATGKPVEIATRWSPTYDVGGEKALTDGIFGTKDYHYNWLGFEGDHLDAVVDLEEAQLFKSISIDFLTYPLSWIYLPEKVEFFVSNDTINWQKIGEKTFEKETKLAKNSIQKAKVDFFNNTPFRYVRVVAQSPLTNPEWHRGYGLPCWIFTDEILIQKRED
ncbi:MAG: DUF4838 domain-containing protein [Bacteroidales bacterium]|nr:DUF4838 domain-containing protein [Bacteroidales bacterium]